MTHLAGNPRGAQHLAKGQDAKIGRQERAWARCSEHKFTVKARSYLVREGDKIQAMHDLTDIYRCRSCGAPGPKQ